MSEEADRWQGFARGLVLGVLAGAVVAVAVASLLDVLDDDSSVTEQARAVIEANYYREVAPEALERESVRAMIAELRRRYGDRYSHYFGPKALEHFDASTSGEFSGVGLTVTEVGRGLRVASVLPDSPAREADLAEGDLITAVDGRSIEGKPADISAALIKGPPGTEVELRIVPATGGPAKTVGLERAQVRVPAVDGEIRRTETPRGEREIGYVRFVTFSEGAHGELRQTVERLVREGAEGIVLDLRGNGGGLLNEAVLSASVFVDEGVIVSTDTRSAGERDYEATGDALPVRPMVVLTNRDTASAAEILAAALSDYELATLVGTRTFGKNTVQEVLRLPAGGALDLTIGEYVTSDGESLAGKGVEPDLKARDDRRTRPDEALRAAEAALRREIER
jgi:carboxyl-terminal processing protease